MKKIILCLSFFIIGLFELEGNDSFKVSLVHFEPLAGKYDINISKMAYLAEEAGLRGSDLCVFPELSTSGYSYYSKSEVYPIAESIPGKTCEFMGTLAKKYQMYIVFGLPEKDELTSECFNTAVILDRAGKVIGKYRKHSHLVESSWSSSPFEGSTVFDTDFGRVSLLICADLCYPELAREAALKGADHIIVPTNGGVSEHLVRTRAIENQCTILISNRYGDEIDSYNEILAKKSSVFSQDSLKIVPSFAYNFNYGTQSIASDPFGNIVCSFDGKVDHVCTFNIQKRGTQENILSRRRPDLYSILSRDTLEPYTFKQMGLPKEQAFPVMAVKVNQLNNINKELKKALDDSSSVCSSLKTDNCFELFRIIAPTTPIDFKLMPISGMVNSWYSFWEYVYPKLVVLPLVIFKGDLEKETFERELFGISYSYGVDICYSYESEGSICSEVVFITPEGERCSYLPVHTLQSSGDTIVNSASNFTVIDRNYARVGLLSKYDLFFPESTRILEKMGVDIVCVPIDNDDETFLSLCDTRTNDCLNIVSASRRGKQRIFYHGWATGKTSSISPNSLIDLVDTREARNKIEIRNYDYTTILKNY